MMKRLRILFSKLNNIGMRQKLLISYILVVLLPVLLVGMILTSSMRNMALEQVTDKSKANVDRIAERIDVVFNLATDISNKFY